LFYPFLSVLICVHLWLKFKLEKCIMVYTIEKIEKQVKVIREAAYRKVFPIPVWKFHEGDCMGEERVDFDDRGWADFRVGERWGGYDITAWFRATVEIPPELAGQKLVIRLFTGPRDGGGSTAEALLYANGRALQGIDIWHTEAWLPPEIVTAGRVTFAFKAWSGVIDVPDQRHFKRAELAWVNEAAESYASLAGTLAAAAKTLDEADLRRIQLVQALDESYACIDFFEPGSPAFYQSVRDALQVLSNRAAAWQAVDEIKPAITAVGHAHIDMAWLWRLKDTREKAARTFSTVLHLMRQYPGYVFLHSSPQLYKFLKQDYPEIYARIKEQAAAGRWEVEGGMWVEADTNLTSGESLVRQFLYGRRFIRDEFGVEMRTLWLPDVFGYSGALPQIMKKSGIRSFLTSKISWSQFNRFPYDTFLWRGLDGSEVLTQFVTTPDACAPFFTYNGTLEPREAQGAWKNYRQKEINAEQLVLFGWGDGGGGPTREMLESARALENLPGLPRVRLGRARDFFARLETNTAGKPLPVWDGELYLEYHRGTYTSQAQIKRANRQAEILYHNAEWLSAAADVLLEEEHYPADALQEGWELILLHQFHDILPGSSIRLVYEDARRAYGRIREIGEGAVERAADRIGAAIGSPYAGLVVFNPLGWRRGGLVELPWSAELECQGLALQRINWDGEKRLLVDVPPVPAMGYQSIALAAVPASGDTGEERAAAELIVTPERLENLFYRIELNERGQLVSVWDRRNKRQVVAAGERGNVLQAFEDRPLEFDAWDIEAYYPEKMREVSELVEAKVEECGPLRGTLRLRWKFLHSEIVQRVTIYAACPRIDFRTEVDWHEHQVLLKAAFPVEIRATRATYEIQFGRIERPTHQNTSWDAARFEVPAHRYADLSEGDYGVSLLNDCKYGYDVKDHTMRLTLIKSGIQPDPTADQGKHTFTYSLFPHAGGAENPEIYREAAALNTPLIARVARANPEGTLPPDFSFARVDADHVVIETVKKAEDDGGWVVRVFESQQYRNPAVHLDFGRPIRSAVECNLVEEEDRPVDWDGDRLTFAIAPFEIKTFKMNFE
jgi:alpha-mannosidase